MNPDPAYEKRALESWDRALLLHETLRLLVRACRAPAGGARLRLLELGCRTGLASRFWARRWPRASLTALDPSGERLTLASARTAHPRWIRRDPRYLSGFLPGAPFDAILAYPWTVGAVRPERLEPWLRGLATLLRAPAPGAGGDLQEGRLLLVLYRPGHLAGRWGGGTGGRDAGDWAWAWEGTYLPGDRRLDLHLLAFVPTEVPGRFARRDEVLRLHAHGEERLRAAARAAGLAGGERPAACSGSLLLYDLRRDGTGPMAG